MARQWWSAALGAAMIVICAAASANEQEDKERYTREAIERVVESHDNTLLVGGGRLMVKQAAIRSARKLLGEWGKEAGLRGEWWDDAPQYRTAKAKLLETADAIMARRFNDGVWLKEAWYEYTAREFSGEEADVIATHFQTEGGQKQRALMDWYLGEFVQFNYTFSDRFEYELEESQKELMALQREAQKRIPREDVEFTSRYPEAFNFIACSPQSRYCPGIKYWKMLAIPLLGEIFRYMDALSTDIEARMRAQRPEIQPYIEAFKAARR